MDEKARLRRFGYGLAATLVLVVLGGLLFGSLGVTAALAVGLAVTLFAGGGLGKR
jgi:hypothetical protein